MEKNSNKFKKSKNSENLCNFPASAVLHDVWTRCSMLCVGLNPAESGLGRQLVCVRARAPADAGADRINGRALLAASRLDSREDGKATHLEQSWR